MGTHLPYKYFIKISCDYGTEIYIIENLVFKLLKPQGINIFCIIFLLRGMLGKLLEHIQEEYNFMTITAICSSFSSTLLKCGIIVRSVKKNSEVKFSTVLLSMVSMVCGSNFFRRRKK